MRALVLVAVMMIPTLAVCGFGGDAGAAGPQAIRKVMWILEREHRHRLLQPYGRLIGTKAAIGVYEL